MSNNTSGCLAQLYIYSILFYLFLGLGTLMVLIINFEFLLIIFFHVSDKIPFSKITLIAFVYTHNMNVITESIMYMCIFWRKAEFISNNWKASMSFKLVKLYYKEYLSSFPQTVSSKEGMLNTIFQTQLI